MYQEKNSVMKKISTLLLLSFLVQQFAFGQLMPPPPEENRKVQVAILLDTSGSMDGLIEQAKSRLWSIVLQMSKLQYNGQAAQIEIALYHYGNSGLSASDNYIQQLVDLTSDLDVVSQKLFSLSTNGGEEYCGAVLSKSVEDLKWSEHPNDLRMIYIAGNEPFNQGPIDFKIICKKAAERDIFINTIYCGDYEQGIREFWYDGSTCTQGSYFNINSNEKIVQIQTPYDKDIAQYNDSLNMTYYGYGQSGMMRMGAQAEEDEKAENLSPNVATERAIVKSKKSTYNNASWDLIDGVDNGVIDLKTIKEEELPEEFKNKTPEEREALLEEKRAQRSAYQQKIGELAKNREAFIADEMQRRAAEGTEQDDFGSSVNKSILEKAKVIGFTEETPGE